MTPPLTTPDSAAPVNATDAVLRPSDPVPPEAVQVHGLDFDHYRHRDITAAEMVQGMARMGFQASGMAEAVRIVDGMARNTAPSRRTHMNEVGW